MVQLIFNLGIILRFEPPTKRQQAKCYQQYQRQHQLVQLVLIMKIKEKYRFLRGLVYVYNLFILHRFHFLVCMQSYYYFLIGHDEGQFSLFKMFFYKLRVQIYGTIKFFFIYINGSRVCCTIIRSYKKWKFLTVVFIDRSGTTSFSFQDVKLLMTSK